MLRFAFRTKPRKLKATFGPGSGPEGRIDRLKMLVTALMRYERIETKYAYCDETRGYAERLIQIAMKNGDKCPETMEIADYWLLEKDLIQKLFKVYVPRYSTQYYGTRSLTDIYRLPTLHRISRDPVEMGLLELKGNPWPPVRPRQRLVENQLHNVLLRAARKDYYQNKHQESDSPINDMSPEEAIEKLREMTQKSSDSFKQSKSERRDSDSPYEDEK